MTLAKYNIVGLIAFLLFITLACLQCSRDSYPLPPPAFSLPVEIKHTTDKDWHQQGEMVGITFLWRNVTHQPVVLKPFPPQIEVWSPPAIKRGTLLWTLVAGVGEHILQPADVVSYTLTWDQRDNNGHMVRPGEYIVYVESQAKGQFGVVPYLYQVPIFIGVKPPQTPPPTVPPPRTAQ